MFFPKCRAGAARVTTVFGVISAVTTVLYCFLEAVGFQSRRVKIQHSVLAWPTMAECCIFAVSWWSLSAVERMLGSKQYRNLLLCAALAYVPLYSGALVLIEWFEDLSLMAWLPYELFVFMLCHIPSTEVYLIITDKLLITLGFVIAIAIHLPYSLVAFVASCIGHALWCYDVFGLSKCVKETVLSDDGVAERIVIEEESESEEEPSVDRNVNSIVEMGFNEFEAANALRRTRNNVHRAVEYLLTH